MAASSLYKDFVISTREEAKGLVDMLDSFDENAKQPEASSASYYEPTKEEMRALINKWQERRNARSSAHCPSA
ncbi:MAG: hypothetical protein IK015_05600 [Treponema sp.]|nr:hypothetical protein [Treponema sp.]